MAESDNLLLAYRKACRGKRRKKEVAAFALRLDEHLARMRRQLLDGNVDVGHYHYFTIHDPKERVICAASFAERVLHHALMNVCHPVFERNLIDATYATRPGKGVYQALERAVGAASRYPCLVKLDFRKYYDSIRHDALKRKLSRLFKDEVLLRVFGQIIDSYEVAPGRGLPIGNLTSQYFANAYLSDLDHCVQEEWKAPVYVRYMDDMLIGGRDKAELSDIVRRLTAFASEQLGLRLKAPVYRRSAAGIPFLGYRVLPYRYLLSGRSKRRFRSKLLLAGSLLQAGVWDESDYAGHVVPLLAFARHAESRGFRRSCMALCGVASERRV